MEVYLSFLWIHEFQGLQEEAEKGFIALGFKAALLDLLLCEEGQCGLYELKVLQQSPYCS